MNRILRVCLALAAAAGLLLTGCQDKHEPVKPTVATAAMR
ncbi:hypothetical protein SAMN05428948_2311 [Massilia sp. CF038]|nr:hypothetical protein SAMN05428948_2311 [Massilia sp. CF038]